LKTSCQSSINEPNFGGTIGFEFKMAYKLHVASQQKTLGILSIELVSSQTCMNHAFIEEFLDWPAFDRFPEFDHNIICDIILGSEAMDTEVVTLGGVVS